jgi:hypothetical protein
MFVLRIHAVSDGDGYHLPVGDPPVYLKSYDIEAHRGRGHAEWTRDLNNAMQFVSFEHAYRAWNTQSKIRPLRPDGKPNKPLTAFSVEVEELK